MQGLAAHRPEAASSHATSASWPCSAKPHGLAMLACVNVVRMEGDEGADTSMTTIAFVMRSVTYARWSRTAKPTAVDM